MHANLTRKALLMHPFCILIFVVCYTTSFGWGMCREGPFHGIYRVARVVGCLSSYLVAAGVGFDEPVPSS